MSNQLSKQTLEVWKAFNHIEHPASQLAIEKAIDSFADFFLPGQFYYYIFNFTTLSFEYVHASIKKVLGIEPEGFNIEKYLSLLHVEDLKVFHEKENTAAEFLFNMLDPEEIIHYKVIYLNRMKKSDGSYIKVLHQAKALKVSEEGKIEHVLGVHTDITHLDSPVTNRVSFVGDEGYDSYYSSDLETIKKLYPINNDSFFTTQELRIVKLIAEGKSTEEIAQLLFIAKSTVKTHRKNILRKANAQNSVQLIVSCFKKGIL